MTRALQYIAIILMAAVVALKFHLKSRPPEPRHVPEKTSTRPAKIADSTPWRALPALAGKFHPEHPDDLPVIVHDGGPRITRARPEAVWVRVTGMTGH
jgi:hypothetical protein